MKNVINYCSILVVCILLGFTTTTQAQQKIAHIDSDAIVMEMPEYKQAKANVEELSKVLQKQLESKQADIQTFYDKTAAKVQAKELSPIEQQEAETKLADMQKQLQKKATEADQKLAEKEQELTKPLYDKFNAAIQKVATTNGFAYILDVKLALYSDGGIDATSLVKAELGL